MNVQNIPAVLVSDLETSRDMVILSLIPGHYTQILFRPARAVGCSAPKEFGGYYVCHFDRIQSSGSVVY